MRATAILSQDPYIGRLGLKEAEFSKLCEKSGGFVKIRDRSACTRHILADPEDQEAERGNATESKWPKGKQCLVVLMHFDHSATSYIQR